MKAQSLADLHRLALASGAELESNGRRFNTERAQIAPAPRAAPPAPVAAPAAAFTREQVEHMLAQNNLRMHEQLAKVLAALRPSPGTAALVQPRQWDFSIEYSPDGAITNVTARATP